MRGTPERAGPRSSLGVAEVGGSSSRLEVHASSSPGVGRRIFLLAGAASLVGCAHDSLARHRGRIATVTITVVSSHEVVVYVAGQPTLVDPLSGPALQNTQIAAGVAALNLQERAHALCPGDRFALLLGESARDASPSIGLTPVGAGAAADATLALTVSRYGVRAPSTDREARYSVEVKALLTPTGASRSIWRRTLEIADAFETLGEGAPATIDAIAKIADPTLQGLLVAMARVGGAGVIDALGRDLRGA